MTFSPLEIAKVNDRPSPTYTDQSHYYGQELTVAVQAFDASILQSIGPVYQGYEVARLGSSRKIQYGVVTEKAATPYPTIEKLMITDEVNAARPRKN